MRGRSIIRPFLSHFWVHTFHLRLRHRSICVSAFISISLPISISLSISIMIANTYTHVHVLDANISTRCAMSHVSWHRLRSCGQHGDKLHRYNRQSGLHTCTNTQGIRNEIFLRMLKCVCLSVDQLVCWILIYSRCIRTSRFDTKHNSSQTPKTMT